MQSGMSITKDSDAHLVTDVTTLADSFERDESPGPNILIKPWAPRLDGTQAQVLSGRWNETIQEQLVAQYISDNPTSAADGIGVDYLRRHFKQRILSLKKARTATAKDATDPAAALLATKSRSLNARKSAARATVRWLVLPENAVQLTYFVAALEEQDEFD